MRIIKYKYCDPGESGWRFDEIEFGKINLLVGESGMGKTRLLNTLFNIGSMIALKKIRLGNWRLDLEVRGVKYDWQVDTEMNGQGHAVVSSERLTKHENGVAEAVVARNVDQLIFNGTELPKLSRTESCISLLQEEEVIQPLYKGFSSILRRNFFDADLTRVCRVAGYAFGLLDKLAKGENLRNLFSALHDEEMNLNSIMYILSKGFPEVFGRISSIYKSIFPFIVNMKVMDIQELEKDIKLPGQVPVFCVKEKGVEEWIALNNLSSGMQKVLLILVDIFTLPEGSIFLIDEYENSLGVNAINFFPNLLFEEDLDIQFFITSHHPYIINKIPVANWYVLHRKGSEVKALFGDKLQQRLGTSRQQAFIKLLNDSFFTEGKE